MTVNVEVSETKLVFIAVKEGISSKPGVPSPIEISSWDQLYTALVILPEKSTGIVASSWQSVCDKGTTDTVGTGLTVIIKSELIINLNLNF